MRTYSIEVLNLMAPNRSERDIIADGFRHDSSSNRIIFSKMVKKDKNSEAMRVDIASYPADSINIVGMNEDS